MSPCIKILTASAARPDTPVVVVNLSSAPERVGVSWVVTLASFVDAAMGDGELEFVVTDEVPDMMLELVAIHIVLIVWTVLFDKLLITVVLIVHVVVVLVVLVLVDVDVVVELVPVDLVHVDVVVVLVLLVFVVDWCS